jgi:hypothetical protein
MARWPPGQRRRGPTDTLTGRTVHQAKARKQARAQAPRGRISKPRAGPASTATHSARGAAQKCLLSRIRRARGSVQRPRGARQRTAHCKRQGKKREAGRPRRAGAGGGASSDHEGLRQIAAAHARTSRWKLLSVDSSRFTCMAISPTALGRKGVQVDPDLRGVLMSCRASPRPPRKPPPCKQTCQNPKKDCLLTKQRTKQCEKCPFTSHNISEVRLRRHWSFSSHGARGEPGNCTSAARKGGSRTGPSKSARTSKQIVRCAAICPSRREIPEEARAACS